MDGLDCLRCLDGVILDGFIEKTFAWDRDRGDIYGLTAYQEPWIGFIHNPPHVPDWFNMNQQSPVDILRSPNWRRSMDSCKGLFTLSSYLKDWLAPQVPVPVCSLFGPTETPATQFSIAKYLLNPDKKLIQIGWWLRKFRSLYLLRVTKVNKVLLSLGQPWTDDVHRNELAFVRDPSDLKSVQVMPYLGNDEYDELLSRNLAFLDLYDSSFNNAIVECIVRATPILVNPLPAVIEYLGENYPFYFRTLEQAAAKAEDESLVVATHQYLKGHPMRKLLTREHFLQSFVESNIYKNLPLSASEMGRIALQEHICKELMDEWKQALAGDCRARAQWQLVEGGQWSWQQNALSVSDSGFEWYAYQYCRCDTHALNALENFVVEVTVSGSGGAAGISFGPFKDFLVELGTGGEHHLQLEVNCSSNSWIFRVDGEPAQRFWWDSSVRHTRDLVGGILAFKARLPGCVWFRNLVIHYSSGGSTTKICDPQYLTAPVCRLT